MSPGRGFKLRLHSSELADAVAVSKSQAVRVIIALCSCTIRGSEVYAVIVKGGLLVNMEREELRRLVDELPENELKAARRYLEFIRDVGKDPVSWALENAPLDDELVTDEERERAARADEDFSAGRTTSMDELKREMGL